MSFGWAYPPGVSGREYEIAGPDAEREVDDECPKCHATEGVEQQYQLQVWTICGACGHEYNEHELDDGPDPDDAYDRMRDGY